MALRITANTHYIDVTKVDGTSELQLFEGNIGRDWWKGDDTIREIRIGGGVAAIEAGAFEGCTNLTKVTLPKSVKLIRGDAFTGCTALEEVVTPRSLESVDCRLGRAAKLTSFTITPSDLTRGSELSLLYASDYDPHYWD